MASTDNQAEEQPSLESKLADLMRALKQNDSESWPGKPQNAIELDLTTPCATSTSSGEAVVSAHSIKPNEDQNSLDALMSAYVNDIQNIRNLDAKPSSTEQQTTEADPSSLDFASLLKKLDELPPLK